MPLRALFIIYMLLRMVCAEVPALSCSSGNVEYVSSKVPLLLGGVLESCMKGCQPRDDAWSNACELTNRKPGIPTIRKCEQAQTEAVVEQLLKDGNEAMLAITPCELHTSLRGRTLWLIGDSLMKNFYFALRCFMLDFWDHSLNQCAVTNSSETERAIYHAADTNISSVNGSRVVTDLPRCIWLLAGGRVCFLHSVRGEELADPDPHEPGLLQTLHASVAQQQDIFYVNFGRWQFHNCLGLQLEPYQRSLRQLGTLFAKTRRLFPNLFFKVSVHDHTACGGQELVEQATKQCLPAQYGAYPLSLGRQVMHVAQSILSRYNVPVVNTYNQTTALYMGHITDRPIPGKEADCTHYCSPGVPEVMRSNSSCHEAASTGYKGAAAAAAWDALPLLKPAFSISGVCQFANVTRLVYAALHQHMPSNALPSQFEIWSMFKALQQYHMSPVAEASEAALFPPAVVAAQLKAAPESVQKPQCVPVTAMAPPPGWSYCDSLAKQGESQAAAASSSTADEQEYKRGLSASNGAEC